MSHATAPLSRLIVNGSGRPTNARWASSKSCLLLISRYCCTARLAALVASVAGLGGVPFGCGAMAGRARAAKKRSPDIFMKLSVNRDWLPAWVIRIGEVGRRVLALHVRLAG